jgi:hypothetical protein
VKIDRRGVVTGVKPEPPRPPYRLNVVSMAVRNGLFLTAQLPHPVRDQLPVR